MNGKDLLEISLSILGCGAQEGLLALETASVLRNVVRGVMHCVNTRCCATDTFTRNLQTLSKASREAVQEKKLGLL